MKAIVIGATGLTGASLLHNLLHDSRFDRVTAVARKPLGYLSPSLTTLQVPFDTLEQLSFEADVAFCCLGTTLKKAGSKEAFAQVDYGYVLAFARACQRQKVSKMILVSSIGAAPGSSNFYLQTKGRAEQALCAMAFPCTVMLRPSMLDGAREESRTGEKIGLLLMKALSFLMVGPLKRYRATPIPKLVHKMVALALDTGLKGCYVIENDKIISD